MLTRVAHLSPYGSPACTIPFASPLTLSLDILKKSPRLHAAYESRLPELPAIPEDVGHVLVHYLHTGTYGSLRPKSADPMLKQICELKTSIQAYAAARAYDLPDLMQLAEAKIGKYGEGLPLPSLLEVARDAYPTLTEGDAWFLDYLRSRIRPHLRDPKLLLGSNLLDQISSILSPNRVLLRTVLELFCERIVARPEPATSLAASTLASPVTSPSSSRPVSPVPRISPPSSVDVRSTTQAEVLSARKTSKATPWPAPDSMSDAAWARSSSPELRLPDPETPRFAVPPSLGPLPVLGQFPELGPVIIDVVPPPGPSIVARAVTESQPDPVPEPEAGTSTDLEADTSAFADTATSEASGQIRDVSETVPTSQREGKDSGKDINRDLPSKALQPIPEVETEPFPQPKAHRPVIREADSGFWEAPDFEPRKEQARSLMELDSVAVAASETIPELESIASSSQVPGTDTRDFAASDADDGNKTNQEINTTKAQEEPGPVPLLRGNDSIPETGAAGPSKQAAASECTSEPVPIESVQERPGEVTDSLELVPPENAAPDKSPETDRNMEIEAQPGTEKVEPLTRRQEHESLLTIL